MKALKVTLSLLLALLVFCLPLTVGAIGEDEGLMPLENSSDIASDTSGGTQTTEEFSLTVECKLDGAVPENTEFVFSVTEAPLVFSDDDETYTLGQETALADFVVNTTDTPDGKKVYTFPEKAKAGGFYYSIKLKSSSNKLAVSDSTEIHVTFFATSTKTEIMKNGEPVSDDSFDEFATKQFVAFNCITATKLTLSTEGCEAFTKIYDGKLTADVTDKCYKLNGVTEGHEVTLSFNKAEFDSADVKKATKVVLSGLKLTGKDAGKYLLDVDKLEIKGTVTPRPLTVTADKVVMTLGQKEPELTYTLSEELIAGNKVVGSLTRTAGETVGTYAVTRGTLSFGDNYEVNFIDGSLTISNFNHAELKDPATSIKVSGYFDPSSTVKVTALDPQSAIYTTLANETSWGKIVSSYDIVFTNNGFDGELTVTIPVDSQYEGKELAVYQQMSNGSIACYKLTAIGGVIAIKTSECSQFMLVAEKDEPLEEESSIGMTVLKVILIILAVIVGLALVIVLFFFGMVFFNKTEQLKAIIRAFRRMLKK